MGEDKLAKIFNLFEGAGRVYSGGISKEQIVNGIIKLRQKKWKERKKENNSYSENAHEKSRSPDENTVIFVDDLRLDAIIDVLEWIRTSNLVTSKSRATSLTNFVKEE